jgi:hypothetical protein
MGESPEWKNDGLRERLKVKAKEKAVKVALDRPDRPDRRL